MTSGSVSNVNRRSRVLLALIVLGSIVADVAGLDWGLPYQWHTDEKVTQAINVLHSPKWDPDYFINPHLHIYLVAAAFKAASTIYPAEHVAQGLPEILPMVDLDSNARRLQFLTMRLARGISVACGIGTVLLLFSIGRLHWNVETGLLAAAFGAATMGLVNLSHFATPESLLILLMLLALRSFDAIIARDTARDYLESGLWIGLACSTKYTACVLAVPFVAAYVAGGPVFDRSRLGHVLLAVAVATAAFIAGTPLIFADWKQFLTFGVEYNWYTGAPTGTLLGLRRSYVPYLQLLGNGLGWPLFALAIAGVAACAIQFFRGDRSSPAARGVLVHGVWIVAFFGFYGLSPHHALRFIVPIAPSLVLLAAAGSVAFVRRLTTAPARRLATAAIGAVLIYSALYTERADYMFEHDTRYAAGEWLNRALGESSSRVDFFEIEAYLPYFRQPRFGLRFVPFIEQVTTHQAAFWTTATSYLRDSDAPIVDSNFYYDRYLDNPRGFPERALFYRHLLAGADPSGFKPIARFTFENPRWLDPRPERVAPEVVVFAKDRKP
jgi:Dolichyl-phosphate-mannose-protein mannosyltransferase